MIYLWVRTENFHMPEGSEGQSKAWKSADDSIENKQNTAKYLDTHTIYLKFIYAQEICTKAWVLAKKKDGQLKNVRAD